MCMCMRGVHVCVTPPGLCGVHVGVCVCVCTVCDHTRSVRPQESLLRRADQHVECVRVCVCLRVCGCVCLYVVCMYVCVCVCTVCDHTRSVRPQESLLRRADQHVECVHSVSVGVCTCVCACMCVSVGVRACMYECVCMCV